MLQLKLGSRLFKFFCDEAIVGRSPGCGVTVNGPMVSRAHCRLRRGPGVLYVKDLGSKNGTMVNNQPIDDHEVAMKPGDLLHVGVLIFEVVETYSLEDPNAVPKVPLSDVVDEQSATMMIHDILGRRSSSVSSSQT